MPQSKGPESMMEPVWERAKEAIKESMDPDSFTRWIAPLRFLEHRDGTLVLGCPNAFFMEWVENHHRARLRETLRMMAGHDVHFQLRVHASANRGNGPKPGQQMRFAQVSPSPLWESGLNGNYTFDRFVVGPCNEFAYTAAVEVARTRKTRYNPLLVLADVGLGKSHLSCAIGNQVLQQEQGDRVFYTTAEGFVNEMVQSLKAKRLEAFKEKFRRQCDVLVLDGVQFLSGKSKTQAELAHTLDALFHAHKRVVLTSNALPREITDMEEGLRSRLTGGLVVDIKPPDPGTRCRILQQKARQEEIQLPQEVAEHLSQRVVGSVRQLESVLIHLLAKASLLHKSIDLDLAKEALRDLYHELALPKKPTIQEILNCVCKHFHIEKDILLSRSRKKTVYHPRQVAMYLCREHTDSTLTAIGKSFRRDHASVIHSLAVIHRKSVTDGTIRNQLSFLAEQILKGL